MPNSCTLKGILALTILFTAASGAQVAVSQYNTCLIRSTNVTCWGYGSCTYNLNLGILPTGTYGIPGTGNTIDLMEPPTNPIDLGDDFLTEAIDCGDNHCCAVSSSKTLKCWGRGGFGQLGQGLDFRINIGDAPNEIGDNLAVIDLGSGFEVDHVSCGAIFTCVLSTSQGIKCFGYSDSGQLGYGNADTIGDDDGEMGDELPVVNLGTNFTAMQVNCGTSHACALSVDHQVKCWGENTDGQLGQGDINNRGDDMNEMGDNLTAIDLGTGFIASSIRCGQAHVCALSTDHVVKCWGSGNAGRLGSGNVQNRGDHAGEMGNNLIAVELGTDFIPHLLSAGFRHNVVLSSNGTIKAWGSNAYGQLGYGDTDSRGWWPTQLGDNLPIVNVGDGYTILDISSGCYGYHSCAFLENGTDFLGLKCWGQNVYGELGLGNVTRIGDEANEMGSNLSFVISFSTPPSPTLPPTSDPTKNPTNVPTVSPTTTEPTKFPSGNPSTEPSSNPTKNPTYSPSHGPTTSRTNEPTTDITYSTVDHPLNVTVDIIPGRNASGVSVDNDPTVINLTRAGFEFGGYPDIGLTDWGTRIDLDAAEFGFIENFKCSLTFKLQGECLAVNGSNEKYCQPLLGFGDDFKYFIISYLVEHSTNETKVYPEHGMNASLAEGDITTILTDYSGDEQGRDEQFYDAVTELGTNGSEAFTFFDGPRTENSWPIHLKVLRNEIGVTIELGNEMGYWSTPFETNSSLHFGILDRLKRDDLGLGFGGFTISLITITRTCTAIPAPPSANSKLSVIGVIAIIVGGICCLFWAAVGCISQLKLRQQWTGAMQMKNGLIVSIAIGKHETNPDNPEISGSLIDLPVQSDIENLRNFAEFLNYQFLTVEGKLFWTKDEVMAFMEEDVCTKMFDDSGNIQFDGLMVFISSHGMHECIISSDYKKVSRTRIHRCISEKYPELREIPRIFVFDACDGTRSRLETPKKQHVDSQSFDREQEEDSEIRKNTEETKNDDEMLTVEALQVESRDTEWSAKYKNPDYNLVAVHGANEEYVSKINKSDPEVGSYLTYFFAKTVRLNIEGKHRMGLAAILKEIQNLLHDAGKQMITKMFFNETENLRIEKNQNVRN